MLLKAKTKEDVESKISEEEGEEREKSKPIAKVELKKVSIADVVSSVINSESRHVHHNSLIIMAPF